MTGMLIFVALAVFAVLAVIVQLSKEDDKKEPNDTEKNYRKAMSEDQYVTSRLGSASKQLVYKQLQNPQRFGKISVHEKSKTVIINGWEYKFGEIIECHLEQQGNATYVTTPDRFQMAEQEFLYGMGQRYNVRTQTQEFRLPSKVCITVSRVSNPLVVITPASQDEALQINSLLNVIIRNNANQHDS